MLLTALFIIEFMVAGVIAYKYGRKQEAAAQKDYWDRKVHNLESLLESETYKNKYNHYEFLQVNELLLLLTDFMHAKKVFERFTNEEINNLFTDARMVTRYNRNHTIEDIENFIERLEHNEMSKLYPGFPEFYKDQKIKRSF